MEPIHINIADIAKVELLMGNIQFSYTRVKDTNIWVQYAADLGPDEVSGFFTCRHCGLYEYDGDEVIWVFSRKDENIRYVGSYRTFEIACNELSKLKDYGIKLMDAETTEQVKAVYNVMVNAPESESSKTLYFYMTKPEGDLCAQCMFGLGDSPESKIYYSEDELISRIYDAIEDKSTACFTMNDGNKHLIDVEKGIAS